MPSLFRVTHSNRSLYLPLSGHGLHLLTKQKHTMYAITIKKQDGDEPERVTVFEEIPMNRAYERYYGEAAIQGKYRAAMTGETTVWLHFQNKVLENLYLLNKTLQHETDDLDNSDANG